MLKSDRLLALQDKGGFFAERADAAFDVFRSGYSVTTQTVTKYALGVGTDTADTPLRLDFNFFGSDVAGSSYYGAGDISLAASATISAGKGPSSPLEVWSFGDQLNLRPGNGWGTSSRETDVQNIGLPLMHTTQGFVGFQSQARIVRDAFFGTLDFGVLQPGEVFQLVYDAFAIAGGDDVIYTGRGSASLVDPFALANRPAFQLSLQGLALPTAPGAVSEPPSWVLMLVGALGLGTLARSRLRPEHLPIRLL